MNGIANASYLAGIIISLLAFGLPISPAALGPGAALFNPDYGILGSITNLNVLIAVLIGAGVALLITVYVSLKYASKMTEIVFKYVSHEAVLALLMGLVFLLVYLDSGVFGVLAILVVGIFSGYLNKQGVNYGVQFMALYAAPWIVEILQLI